MIARSFLSLLLICSFQLLYAQELAMLTNELSKEEIPTKEIIPSIEMQEQSLYQSLGAYLGSEMTYTDAERERLVEGNISAIIVFSEDFQESKFLIRYASNDELRVMVAKKYDPQKVQEIVPKTYQGKNAFAFKLKYQL